MQISAYAPAKAILFGEHYVVYGAKGIVAAIEPYNFIDVNMQKGEGLLDYVSNIGGASVKSAPKEAEKKKTKHPVEAVYKRLLQEFAEVGEYSINAKVKECWGLKGVGNSSSLAACFSRAVREGLQKECSKDDIFLDVQAADEAVHGKASGIDASAVSYGGVLEFGKNFKGGLPHLENIKIDLPKGFAFLLIDTFEKAGEKTPTAQTVGAFAKSKGLKSPSDAGGEKRKEICSQYNKVFADAKEALAQRDIVLLAKCMEKNHSLLKEAGVSSPGIEEAVMVAKNAGALGAKLTAGGGKGGAVIALAENDKLPKIENELKEGGFPPYEFRIADRGAHSKLE